MALAEVDELTQELKWSREPLAAERDSLQLLLDSATADLESLTGRMFTADPEDDGEDAVQRTFTTYGDSDVTLETDLRPAPAPTLELAGQALVLNEGYALVGMSRNYPYATHIDLAHAWGLWQWRGGNDDLVVTGWWGWRPADPQYPAAKRACLQLAARYMAEKGARWADAVQTPEGGVYTYLKQIPAGIRTFVDAARVPKMAIA